MNCQRLSLERCQLTSICVEYLAPVLKTCKILLSLHLNGIVLDCDGAVVLREDLAHPNCGLKMLALDKCA